MRSGGGSYPSLSENPCRSSVLTSGQPFARSAVRDVDDRYASKIQSVDRTVRDRLGDAVANAAMTLESSSRMAGADAVRLAKNKPKMRLH